MLVNACEENQNGLRELLFDVGENAFGIKTLRIFGENLLHVELGTEYGKKEFVCAKGEGILNHVMLRPFDSIEGGSVERLSFFASYETADGVVLITLRYSDNTCVQHWSVNSVEGKLEAVLEPSGLSLVLALERRENNG